MPIRGAVPQDGPTVAGVQVRSWRAAYRGVVPQDFLDAMETERRGTRWSEWIARASWPRAGMLVAEDSGGPVAFACSLLRTAKARAAGRHLRSWRPSAPCPRCGAVV